MSEGNKWGIKWFKAPLARKEWGTTVPGLRGDGDGAHEGGALKMRKMKVLRRLWLYQYRRSGGLDSIWRFSFCTRRLR